MRARRCLLAWAVALTGCAQYADVSRVHPHLDGAAGSGPLASVEAALSKVMQQGGAHPLDAIGNCLTALRAASVELARDSSNPIARRDYNFGIARLFDIVSR